MNVLARADFLDFDLIDGMERAMTYADLAGIYGEQDLIDTPELVAYEDQALADFFAAQQTGTEAEITAQLAYESYLAEIMHGEFI